MYPAPCIKCEKPEELCVCSSIQPRKPKLKVVILQHPQEPDKLLGTARLAHLALEGSTLKVGLSWPNLKKVLGEETQNSRWGVIYLGSGVKGGKGPASPLTWVSKKGEPLDASKAPRPNALDGVIILDGTWSQAKALWWRNAWLLKLNRGILNPRSKSLYRELRKEPRAECLSTLESIAETLDALGESPETGKHLRDLFSQLLDQFRKMPRKRPQ